MYMQPQTKRKFWSFCYTSKTHGKSSYPQKVKITSNCSEKTGSYLHRHFCPFHHIKKYLTLRGDYGSVDDPFFVFSDGTPVSADIARKFLRQIISKINIDPTLYDIYSLRIGRTSDLIKYSYTVEQVKFMGRWKSNAVYCYIRQ